MVMQRTGTDVATTDGRAVQLEDARLTPQSIANTKEQMALAEQLVLQVLQFNVDFGNTPGTRGAGLWDPGAAKIIRAFNCHIEHKVLFHEESDELVTYTVEAMLINNQTNQIVGSGLGAASTRETKYKYRWVERVDALREGYTEEDISSLKTKPKYGNNEITLFRIDNPEYGELVHTMLVMSAKRAEVDAAKSLPGVGAALRVKFDEKPPKPGESSGQEDLTLPVFWAMAKGAGLSEDDVHRMLGVTSMKIWKESGKTYREAIIQLMKVAVTAARATKKTKKAPEAGGEDLKPGDITQEQVKTVDALVALCNSFWGMTEQQVFKELGYASRANFSDAKVQSIWEAWLTILAVKQPAP